MDSKISAGKPQKFMDTSASGSSGSMRSGAETSTMLPSSHWRMPLTSRTPVSRPLSMRHRPRVTVPWRLTVFFRR